MSKTKTVQNPYENKNTYQWYTPTESAASDAVKNFQWDPTLLNAGVNSAFANNANKINENFGGYNSSGNKILDQRMKQNALTENAGQKSNVLSQAWQAKQAQQYGQTMDYARLMAPQLQNQSSSGYTSQTIQQPTFWGSMLQGATQLGSAALSASTFLCDVNLKQDVAPLDTAEAQKIVETVPGYKWNYKGSMEPGIGVMAQDLEAVCPDAVVDFADFKGIRAQAQVGILWGALQETLKQVRTLQQEVETLKNGGLIYAAQ